MFPELPLEVIRYGRIDFGLEELVQISRGTHLKSLSYQLKLGQDVDGGGGDLTTRRHQACTRSAMLYGCPSHIFGEEGAILFRTWCAPGYAAAMRRSKQRVLMLIAVSD